LILLEKLIYLAGWELKNNNLNLVVARTSATLVSPLKLEVIDSRNALVLNSTCFDVWTDINKPHMYIDTIDGDRHLIIAVSGRCGGFYKVNIQGIIAFFSTVIPKCWTEEGTDRDIFSVSYNNATKTMFYTYKEYNSDKLDIFQLDMKGNMQKTSVSKSLNSNETIPVLGYDRHLNKLFVALTDSDRILQLNGDTLKDEAVATLPISLRKVSSILVRNGFLYLATWEPSAKVGRIDLKQSFCNNFCGAYAYCSQPPNGCSCIQGYVFNDTDTSNPKPCVPKHEVDIQRIVREERSLAITLGILFGVALLGAIAGWVLWWRGRRRAVYNIKV